ncbi:MAG: VOC family protein [Bacillota bacterium]
MKDAIHFYPASDLKAVKKVYGDLLGLPLYKDQGKCLIYDLEGHGKIGFCTHHPKNPPASTCVTFVYQDKKAVDRMFDKVKDTLEVLSAPEENTTFKIYHTFLKDPQGIHLEFQTFLD